MAKRNDEARMKVTLINTLAGPHGTAKPGTVIEVSQQVADKMFKSRAARPFDRERDGKATRGLQKHELVAAQ